MYLVVGPLLNIHPFINFHFLIQKYFPNRDISMFDPLFIK
jgi:hypothetical protein